MVITLTGYVFMALCLIFAFLDVQRFLDLVILSLILQSSAFCIIGDLGIPLSIPVEIMFCCVCFLKFKVKMLHIKKTHFFLLIFIIWTSVLTVISPILFQDLHVLNISTLSYEKLVFTWGKLAPEVFLLVNFCTFLVIYSHSQYFDRDHIIHILKIYILLILIVGIWHYYSKNNGAVSELFLRLIYSNTAVSPGYSQDRFLATFFEPSYCGLFLSSMFWALIFYEDNMSINNISIFLCILGMLCLNISSTGIFTFVIGGMLYFISFKNQEKKVIKMVLIFLVGCLIISLLIRSNFLSFEMLQSQMFKKKESMSYYVRDTWNRSSIKTFVESGFLGVGSTYTRASSLLFNLLVQTGLGGTIVYFLFVIFLLLDQFKVKSKFSIFIFWYLILTFIGMLFSSPDVTMTNIWIGLFGAAANYDFGYSAIRNDMVKDM